MPLEKSIRDSGEVLGRFWLPDASSSRHEDAAGVLRFSSHDGAELQLVGPLQGWPSSTGGPPQTIHGVTVDGDQLSLLNAWVSRVMPGGRAFLNLRSSTLVVDDHALPHDRWKRLLFRTANLHEWLPETGVAQLDSEYDNAGLPRRYEWSWERPKIREVEIPGARLSFAPTMQTAVSFSPDQSLVTGMEIMVEAQRATTLDLLRRRFARPLRNLLVFASDRPDGLIRERVSSPAKGRRAVLLGQGEDLAPREWNPAHGYLFRALELPDFEHAIQAWFKLDAVAGPAMDQFAGTVMYGNSYGHSRLVELATALESYSRARHAKRKNEWALTKLKRLAAYARIPRREIGSSVPRLKLLLASRNYYAHLNKPSYGIKVSKVEAEQLNSIRRGHALMQACLLREIGLSTAEARDLLQRHYLGWSIPR